MISGTPILDIKPYHHLESIDMTGVKYPEWIRNQASEEQKAIVIFLFYLIKIFFRLKFLKMRKIA